MKPASWAHSDDVLHWVFSVRPTSNNKWISAALYLTLLRIVSYNRATSALSHRRLYVQRRSILGKVLHRRWKFLERRRRFARRRAQRWGPPRRPIELWPALAEPVAFTGWMKRERRRRRQSRSSRGCRWRSIWSRRGGCRADLGSWLRR